MKHKKNLELGEIFLRFDLNELMRDIILESADLIELMHASNGAAQIGHTSLKGLLYDARMHNIGFAEGLVGGEATLPTPLTSRDMKMYYF